MVKLVNNTLRRLQLLAQQKHITLESYYDDHLTVSGDSVKLQQVVSNIVDNAIKYTPEGWQSNGRSIRKFRKCGC